jgi:hypothetical protein
MPNGETVKNYTSVYHVCDKVAGRRTWVSCIRLQKRRAKLPRDRLSLSEITLHLSFLHHNGAWAENKVADGSWDKAINIIHLSECSVDAQDTLQMPSLGFAYTRALRVCTDRENTYYEGLD